MSAKRILIHSKLLSLFRRRTFQSLCALPLLLLTASCQSAPAPSATQPDAATRTETSVVTTQQSAPAAPADDQTLTPQQVGRVRLGMTVGEIKRMFPTAALRLASLPDIPSIVAVRQSEGADLFYFSTARMDEGNDGQLPGDDERVTQIVTSNPQFKTPEGIGAGSSLDDAAKAYGAPKLFYSPDAEYAKFERQPASQLGFWVKPPAGEKTAGVYRMTPDELSGGFYQSTRFHPGAQISYISITGGDADTAKPAAPAPGGSSQVAEPLRSVVQKVKGETGVPLLLPSELPSTLSKQTIYASGSATANGYEISLSSRPECGANSCFIGSLEAERGGQPAFDRQVKLAQNVTGYYQPTSCGGSCSPPIIEWVTGGVLYHIQLNVQWRTQLKEDEEERLMIEVANSAINAGAR